MFVVPTIQSQLLLFLDKFVLRIAGKVLFRLALRIYASPRESLGALRSHKLARAV
jgi:hypothetical protein